jgi:HD-GYP domain-containing protein (c-di-GMP phosphodiesterase class II)/DNA-binding CsgD family transcriptional regulator
MKRPEASLPASLPDIASRYPHGVEAVPPVQPRVRLAEVVGSLSLATDLSTGQPLEHGLRRALLAVWLGEDLGLSGEELSTVYYVALLGTVGCTIEAATLSEFFKDEIAFVEQVGRVDPTRQVDLASFFLSKVGEGQPPPLRVRKILEFARAGPDAAHAVCRDVALQIGAMLEIGPEISQAIAQCHERWDGKGSPKRLSGGELSVAACLLHMAHDADIYHRIGGVDAAISVAQQRAGKLYDPRIAEHFCKVASSYLPRLQSEATWVTVMDTEPEPIRMLSPRDLDAVLETIASFVDLRSQYTLGHSHGVAMLAEGGARRLGMSDSEIVALHRSGLLHDIGRVGVPATFWNKAEPLTAAEWERMKTHPSLTEQVLARSNALSPLGALAALHHERLDGSGYRGVTASFLPVAARVLAIADAYQSKIEPRPHRAGLSTDEAAEAIRGEVREGRLDRDAAEAVLDGAGHTLIHERRAWPAELTDREVEVLRLAVRGLSNREMAQALVVSPKTVGHHVEHIYAKIGVSTRAAATLFALQHSLVDAAHPSSKMG